MSDTNHVWKHLERKPGSRYRQLFVKGKNLRALTLYSDVVNDGKSVKEIAAEHEIPVEAVAEAIAYCKMNPPEIDEELRRLHIGPCHPTPSGTVWQHLDRKRGSAYKQLFVKDRRIQASSLYGAYVAEPMTMTEIAEDYDLPIEVVAEAIAYCLTDPPEIIEDYRREEENLRAAGLLDPESRWKGQRPAGQFGQLA